MTQQESLTATFRQTKELATGIKHEVALEKLVQAESCANDLLTVVSDIPAPAPHLISTYCPSPAEFHKNWASLGKKRYAIRINVEDNPSDNWRHLWYFADTAQDAAAIGLRWHQRNFALEQRPIEQDGEVVYGYEICGYEKWHPHDQDLIGYLYTSHLWQRVGVNMNAKATPEIMTKLRLELFQDMLNHLCIQHDFFSLDLESPDIQEFFSDWENELEAARGKPF